MRITLDWTRSLAVGALIAAGLILAACSSTQNPLESATAAVPGTPQDFIVNAGDRVFFQVDSAALTPEARATLDKQAVWLQT